MCNAHLSRQPALDLSNLSLPVSLIFGWRKKNREEIVTDRVIYRNHVNVRFDVNPDKPKESMNNLDRISLFFLYLFFLLLTDQQEKSTVLLASLDPVTWHWVIQPKSLTP